MNRSEAVAEWRSDSIRFGELGAAFPSVMSYIPDEWRNNFTRAMDEFDFRGAGLAMDAQPTLYTTPNSAVPWMLTTLIDPKVFRILFSPNKAAQILPEVRKGTWLDEYALFPQAEVAGEVSSYGDYNNNGGATANVNWPSRTAYLFQIIKQYGERELERAGLSKINWVSELDVAAATIMNKYSNLTYFFGVAGIANYGLLNDPNLSAALTPASKAYGGAKWVNNGVIVATANEIYLDIETLFIKLVQQTAGLVDRESAMTLALSPQSEAALTATNSFNVNVSDLLKKNFPNLKVISAVQYGTLGAANPQGVAAGEFAQLIANEVEGQEAGQVAFNEKMRAHPIIRDLSSWKQKQSGGTWGAIIRMPMLFSSMVGL